MRGRKSGAVVATITLLLGAVVLPAALPVAAAGTPNYQWVEQTPASSPPGRIFYSSAFDAARGETVVFGGITQSPTLHSLADTWVWDGSSWTERFPAHSPPARHGAMMTYDAVHQRVVLFGGISAPTNATFADTWTWDGTDWIRLFPATSPSARFSSGFAFDTAHNNAVLFGGGQIIGGVGSKLGDTWTWDGTTWSQQTPLTSPVYRDSTAMSYDEAHDEIVLFGGLGGPGNYAQSDTWVWNGASWTQRFPTHHPTTRFGAASSYATHQRRVVLFGGYVVSADYSTNYGNDTWLWDGTDWTQVLPPTSPSARSASLVFDTVRHQLVLFGGTSSRWSQGVAEADTWLLITTPGVPAINEARVGDTVISIAFTPPQSDGGSPITGYDGSCISNNGGAPGSASTGSSPIAIRGLTNGASYTCSIAASNNIGKGEATFVNTVPPGPTVSVGDGSIAEGDSGTRVLKIPVTLSRPVSATVTVRYSVSGLDAVGASRAGPGVDFKSMSGVIQFSPNLVTGLTPVARYISVTVFGDIAPESDELASVVLSDPSPNVLLDRSTGTVSILDDDPGTAVSLAIGDATIMEGNAGIGRSLVFPVTLSSASTVAVTANYSVTPVDAAYGKTATAESDFGGKVSGTISFPLLSSGTTAVRKTISIPIWPDSRVEPTETFTITLGTPSGPVVVTRAVGTGTIYSDD